MIKNIVFDMGDVLVEFSPQRFVEHFCQDQDDRALLVQEIFKSVEWLRLDRGTISDHEAAEAICSRIPQRLHETVYQILDHWYEKELRPFPEVETIIKKLKEQGYALYVLSNASIHYHEFSKRIPAIQHFDGEFISADVKLLKPSHEIYETFLSHFELVPEECFFIDDMPANIEGAVNAGMSGYIYRQDPEALMQALRAAKIVV